MKTIAEISAQLGLEFQGDGEVSIAQVGSLNNAGSNAISFLSGENFIKQLMSTSAAAVIIHAEHVDKAPAIPLIISENPYASYARAAQLLNPQTPTETGIHATAIVGAGAEVAADCFIGPNVVLEDNVSVAKGVQIGAGCYIGNNVSIGAGCIIDPNVTLLKDVVLGKRVIIHPGVVLGADGFGFAEDNGEWVKIPQLGKVIIGDDVEIGASTSIDRGAIDDTVIGDGVKIDNQVQIGHNVKIGAHTIISGCVGIAGSAVIGEHCKLAGQVGVAGHLEIASGTVVTGDSMVTHSLQKGVYSSGLATQEAGEWRKNAVRLRRLNELFNRVKKLENK